VKRLSIRRKADADLDAALDAYADRPASAAKLLRAFEAAFRSIARHPDAGSRRWAIELQFEELRHRVVRRFPYLVFYVVLPTEVAVIRILHQHRDIPQAIDG
jgi:toxin ParE1/3/4